jgi:hypothetical protein
VTAVGRARALGATVLLVAALGACRSTTTSTTTSTTASSPGSTTATTAAPTTPATASPSTDAHLPLAEFGKQPAGGPDCQPASPIAGAEVMGTAPGGSLYGLLFAGEPPSIVAGQEIKIVWRMTGAGALAASARSGDADAQLTFGPEPHSGSNYVRPGDEWGTGWIFPTPGCWDVHLTRGTLDGHVWLTVQPA